MAYPLLSAPLSLLASCSCFYWAALLPPVGGKMFFLGISCQPQPKTGSVKSRIRAGNERKRRRSVVWHRNNADGLWHLCITHSVMVCIARGRLVSDGQLNRFRAHILWAAVQLWQTEDWLIQNVAIWWWHSQLSNVNVNWKKIYTLI